MDTVYELPFGPGKRYLNGSGILDRLAGSWELSSIWVARTGFPVNVTVERSSSDVPDGNTGNQRPDRVPGVSLIPPGGSTIAEWINPAAFAAPPPGTFGNTPRNVARGPGQWQVDLSVKKRMTLTEGLRLDFRAEVFNIFNHPQYGLPQADLSAGPGVFGSIISSVISGPVGTGTPRQIQFMLRMTF
jgi:hypothetical protein